MRVALVTGASTGLGRCIAERLLSDGLHVVGSARTEQRLQWLVDAGGTAVTADLREPDAPTRLVASCSRLDVLVNNAVAHVPDAGAAEVSDESWEQILLVDLTAAMRLIRAALPVMDPGGSIINVSSRAAQRGTPGHAAYSAAKGGLEALTRSVAVDAATTGIRCNAVAPGYILHSERDAAATPNRLAALQGQQLLPLTTGPDVAAVVSFLASPESRALTGLTIPVDGGATIARATSVG